MTYMEIVEADDANPNTIKEPAKAWRNWYRALTDLTLIQGRFDRGEVYPGTHLWPSKDVAETQAESCRRGKRYPIARGASEYLGAFPEGERP